MLHIPNRTMGSMGRLKLQPSNFADEALKQPDVKELQMAAFARLTELGFFADSAKELQGIVVKIKNSADPWENPNLPDTFTYRATVVHKPLPLVVITRNQVIRGNKFEPKRCRFPFVAFNTHGVTIGAEGRGVRADQFKLILMALSETIVKPKQRP